MKDGILLLLIGVLCAAVAWLFWHEAGWQAGAAIIGGVSALNWIVRWRRIHKQKKAQQTKE